MTTFFKLALFLCVAASRVLLNSVAANISLGSCSLSCEREDNGISDPGLSHPLRGLPGVSGKRGPAGPRGNPGIHGAPGPAGRPGNSCDCSYQRQFQEDLEMLKSSIEKLKGASGWFQGSNGLYYKLFEEKLNYNNARTECENLGGRLAATGWRDALVKKKLMSVIPENVSWMWIGMDDHDRTNIYVWSDKVVANRQNTDWDVNEPNSSGEHCGLLTKNSEKFHDATCSQKHAFICEKNI